MPPQAGLQLTRLVGAETQYLDCNLHPRAAGKGTLPEAPKDRGDPATAHSQAQGPR